MKKITKQAERKCIKLKRPSNAKKRLKQCIKQILSNSICPDARQNQGYMTLFSCLVFLVLMGGVFLCLDGIMIHQGESRGKAAIIGVGEHLLANYNEPLANMYHLYFLDPQMEGRLEQRAKDYLAIIFYSTKTAGFQNNHLLRLNTDQVEIESFGNMQEQQCLYLKHQIREYMKYDKTKDAWLTLVSHSAKQMEQQNEQIRNIKQSLGEKEQAALKEKEQNSSPNILNPSTEEKQKEVAEYARKNDPRKAVQQIMKNGVLEFVTGGEAVSKKKIVLSTLPSKIQKERNRQLSTNLFQNLSEMGKLLSVQDMKSAMKDWKSDGFTYQYIRKFFNSYVEKEKMKDTQLEYEMEYILGGQQSDQENLNYVANRLLLLRFSLNFLYAVKDPELNSQALSLATALVGVTGLIPVVEAVKYSVLGAVSFGEALLDVRNLMSKGKVPMLKTKKDWKMSVTGTIKDAVGEKGKSGMGYEEYLVLLLGLQIRKDKMYLRMQDLMQVNIQRTQPGFLIEKCRFGFWIKSQIRLKTWFGNGSYRFCQEHKFCY